MHNNYYLFACSYCSQCSPGGSKRSFLPCSFPICIVSNNANFPLPFFSSNQIAELNSASWSTDIQNKLATLFVGANDIDQIQNLESFRSLTWLSLDSNLLQRIENLPKSIQTLSLANNFLVSYVGLNRLLNLNWIILSNNYIKDFVIPVRKNIDKLDLSNNFISTLDFNLNETYYIKDLMLSYNQITRLNPNTFKHLSVSRLYLNYNKINDIHEAAFNHLNNYLEYLDLENNGLTNINNCFRNLKKLKYLYLHNNNIEFVHNSTFEHLINLKSISLSGNKLTRIPNFIHNKRLVHLNLGYNFLNELEVEYHQIIENEILVQSSTHLKLRNEDNSIVNDQPIIDMTTHIRPMNNRDGFKNVIFNHDTNKVMLKPSHKSNHKSENQWFTNSNELTDSIQLKTETSNIYRDLSNYAKQLDTFHDDYKKKRHFKAKNSHHENFQKYFQKNSKENSDKYNKKETISINIPFNKLKDSYEINEDLTNDRPHREYKKHQSQDQYSYKMYDYNDEVYKLDAARNKRSLTIEEPTGKISDTENYTNQNLKNRTWVKHRQYTYYNDHNYNKYVRYKKNIITINKTFEDDENIDKKEKFVKNMNSNNSIKAKKKSVNKEEHNPDTSKLFSNLETLLLRCNKITDLNGNLFKHLKKLQELSLSFNKVQVVELNSDAFDGFENLKILEISFSLFNLNEFPHYLLNKNLNTLVWLAMDNNNIKTIRNYALYNLTNLNYINLEYNKISKIHNNLFHFNIHKKLKEIRLSNNYLDSIESDTFYNLKELNTIMLSYNVIKTLKTSGFKNLNSLLNIVLSFNQIKYIYPNAFINLPNLIKVDLQHNKLKDFNLNIFSNISNKQIPMSLNLSHNFITNLYENDKKQAPVYIKSLDLSNNRIQEVPVNFLQTFADSLRKLYLDFNEIKHLDATAFGNLDVLEILSLEHNNIAVVVKRTFIGMPNLQIIDMSFNEISMLTGEQFYFSIKLRVLNIGHNRLRSLPRDVFSNTVIEKLDISYNSLVTMPSNALGGIGLTLRDIDLSHNQIEHIDSTMFIELPMITNLNLSNNRLTILPDNTFISVNTLIQLDLSFNPLRANFKELFHYLQKLKYLYLSNTNLLSFPQLPLPDLLTLDISNANIETVPEKSAELLGKLRKLILSGNQIQSVPSHIWNSLPYLKELDLSNNPLRVRIFACEEKKNPF